MLITGEDFGRNILHFTQIPTHIDLCIPLYTEVYATHDEFHHLIFCTFLKCLDSFSG